MRKQCLTIGLILIALSLCMAYSAYAETVAKASAIVATEGAGFDAGYGVKGENSNIAIIGLGWRF